MHAGCTRPNPVRANALARSPRCSVCRNWQVRFERNKAQQRDRRRKKSPVFDVRVGEEGFLQPVFTEVSERDGKSKEEDASGFDSTASSLDVGDEVYYQFRSRSHGETSQAAALAVVPDVEVVSQWAPGPPNRYVSWQNCVAFDFVFVQFELSW